jgi:hypothetical protein
MGLTEVKGTTTVKTFALCTFEATYVIDGAEGVIVTVMGPSADAVRTFTAGARFHFDLAGPAAEAEPDDEPTPDKLTHDDLAVPLSESLLISFLLTPAAAEAHPSGTLNGVIDPTVTAARYNNFYVRDPLNDTVAITVSVSAGTGVEARLYRVCIRVANLVQPLGAPAGSVSRTGAGRFDLVVYGSGTAPQTSTYQVRGTWAYDYSTGLPSESQASITC